MSELVKAAAEIPEDTPPYHNWEALGQELAEPLYDPETGLEIFPCDLPTCRARKTPETLSEYVEAFDHLKHHEYLGGCSHAR